MKESPLFWPVHLKGNIMFVLDETLLPSRLYYIKVKNVKEAVRVIREMKTRAFGQFLVVMNTFLLELENIYKEKKYFNADKRRSNADGRGLKRKNNLRKSAFPPKFVADPPSFMAEDPRQSALNEIQKIATALNNSRPTFPFSEVTAMVLGWAQKAVGARRAVPQRVDLKTFLEKNILGFLEGIRGRRLERVRQIAQTIKDGQSVLTHCNVSGELAMAASLCKTQNKKVKFFATETRPYLQGAKLTCWELKKAGADVTLIADNAVGFLMRSGVIDLVITGSDRSCANGDIANKIGSYQIAVLAKEFGIPYYALTQPSNKIKEGKDIPIEIRDPDELLKVSGKRIAPRGTKGFYPGFDVVPHELIERPIAIHVH